MSCFFLPENNALLFGFETQKIVYAYSVKLRKLNQERGCPFDFARLILRIGILRHMQLLCQLGLR